MSRCPVAYFATFEANYMEFLKCYRFKKLSVLHMYPDPLRDWQG